ncbi:MAG: acylphosphatase [Anaerolineales bacterium]
MMDEINSRLHATVTGRVQGVSFRYFVMENADALDLRGWVRNRWDGSVEVTAEGSRKDLEQLLQALRAGPPMARVDHVEFEWLDFTGEFSGFNLSSTK